jgi:uncharacterized protein YciW
MGVVAFFLVVCCALVVHAYHPKFVSKMRSMAKVNSTQVIDNAVDNTNVFLQENAVDKRPMMNKNSQFIALMRNLPQNYYKVSRRQLRLSLSQVSGEEKQCRRRRHRRRKTQGRKTAEPDDFLDAQRSTQALRRMFSVTALNIFYQTADETG